MLLFQISNPVDILVKPQHHHLIPEQQITGQSSQATNQFDKLHSSCQALNLHFKAWGTTTSCYYSHFFTLKNPFAKKLHAQHNSHQTIPVIQSVGASLSFLESKVNPDMMQLQHTTWASLLSVLIANGGGNWWSHFDSGQTETQFFVVKKML